MVVSRKRDIADWYLRTRSGDKLPETLEGAIHEASLRQWRRRTPASLQYQPHSFTRKRKASISRSSGDFGQQKSLCWTGSSVVDTETQSICGVELDFIRVNAYNKHHLWLSRGGFFGHWGATRQSSCTLSAGRGFCCRSIPSLISISRVYGSGTISCPCTTHL